MTENSDHARGNNAHITRTWIITNFYPIGIPYIHCMPDSGTTEGEPLYCQTLAKKFETEKY